MIHTDANAPRARRPGLTGGLLAGLLALSACVSTTSMGDGIAYAPPARAAAGPVVLTVTGSKGQALRAIAADLRRAGFVIDGQDPASGSLRARSNRQDLVDCGVLTQTAQGATANISGAAPLAAIFDAGAKGGVLRREVQVGTEVTVQLQDGPDQKATLDEKQTVTLRTLTVDGKTLLSSQTLEATKGGIMAFSDGTICTSRGRLAEAFR